MCAHIHGVHQQEGHYLAFPLYIHGLYSSHTGLMSSKHYANGNLLDYDHLEGKKDAGNPQFKSQIYHWFPVASGKSLALPIMLFCLQNRNEYFFTWQRS